MNNLSTYPLKRVTAHVKSWTGRAYNAVVEFINQYNDEHIEPCDECGYYEDAVACHYEDCQKLNDEE